MLKRKQIEQTERGKIKKLNVYIITSYYQLSENGGILPFLILLAAAIGKAALKNDISALGIESWKKTVDKVIDSLNPLLILQTLKLKI